MFHRGVGWGYGKYLAWICLLLEKNIKTSPNGSLMVMNPMVGWVKHQTKGHDRYKCTYKLFQLFHLYLNGRKYTGFICVVKSHPTLEGPKCHSICHDLTESNDRLEGPIIVWKWWKFKRSKYDLRIRATWMSQEVSKWLYSKWVITPIYPIYK